MSKLKKKLLDNNLTYGSWLTLGSTAVTELMSACREFDWLTVDMEHSSIELKEAQELIRVIELSGIVPLVRVGENNFNIIKRVMDAGAHGVIVPMVNSKEDAEAAVAAVKYPPRGKRGVGLGRAQGYGFSFENYKKWVDQESIVIAQVEHIKAIENLEAILNTPGVDGSIIGPYDLSGSVGALGEFNNPAVEEALKTYEHICAALQKPMGAHVVQPDAGLVKSYLNKGYTFIAIGLDTLFLGSKIKEVFEEVKDN